MKRKLLLFLLSICFFLPDFAATGQYNFIRVDGGSGLSNSHVKSIIQDSYGFIWLGTRNGLNRYDGVSMKLYNCYDETLQHGNQVISALFEDNHRQLWVGTDDGVYIQELATATAYGLPVILCIFNNSYLGMVRQWQQLFYGKRYSSTCTRRRKSCRPFRKYLGECTESGSFPLSGGDG